MFRVYGNLYITISGAISDMSLIHKCFKLNTCLISVNRILCIKQRQFNITRLVIYIRYQYPVPGHSTGQGQAESTWPLHPETGSCTLQGTQLLAFYLRGKEKKLTKYSMWNWISLLTIQLEYKFKSQDIHKINYNKTLFIQQSRL